MFANHRIKKTEVRHYRRSPTYKHLDGFDQGFKTGIDVKTSQNRQEKLLGDHSRIIVTHQIRCKIWGFIRLRGRERMKEAVSVAKIL